jgi:hypothetical protein
MAGAQGGTGPDDKHRDAVRNTLKWADEAAGRSDYEGAIAWLDTITAIGDSLPSAYHTKRAAWQAALTADGQLK